MPMFEEITIKTPFPLTFLPNCESYFDPNKAGQDITIEIKENFKIRKFIIRYEKVHPTPFNVSFNEIQLYDVVYAEQIMNEDNNIQQDENVDNVNVKENVEHKDIQDDNSKDNDEQESLELLNKDDNITKQDKKRKYNKSNKKNYQN